MSYSFVDEKTYSKDMMELHRRLDARFDAVSGGQLDWSKRYNVPYSFLGMHHDGCLIYWDQAPDGVYYIYSFFPNTERWEAHAASLDGSGEWSFRLVGNYLAAISTALLTVVTLTREGGVIHTISGQHQFVWGEYVSEVGGRPYLYSLADNQFYGNNIKIVGSDRESFWITDYGATSVAGASAYYVCVWDPDGAWIDDYWKRWKKVGMSLWKCNADGVVKRQLLSSTPIYMDVLEEGYFSNSGTAPSSGWGVYKSRVYPPAEWHFEDVASMLGHVFDPHWVYSDPSTYAAKTQNVLTGQRDHGNQRMCNPNALISFDIGAKHADVIELNTQLDQHLAHVPYAGNADRFNIFTTLLDNRSVCFDSVSCRIVIGGWPREWYQPAIPGNVFFEMGGRGSGRCEFLDVTGIDTRFIEQHVMNDDDTRLEQEIHAVDRGNMRCTVLSNSRYPYLLWEYDRTYSLSEMHRPNRIALTAAGRAAISDSDDYDHERYPDVDNHHCVHLYLNGVHEGSIGEGVLSYPEGLAWNFEGTKLYVCDRGNDRIAEYTFATSEWRFLDGIIDPWDIVYTKVVDPVLLILRRGHRTTVRGGDPDETPARDSDLLNGFITSYDLDGEFQGNLEYDPVKDNSPYPTNPKFGLLSGSELGIICGDGVRFTINNTLTSRSYWPLSVYVRSNPSCDMVWVGAGGVKVATYDDGEGIAVLRPAVKPVLHRYSQFNRYPITHEPSDADWDELLSMTPGQVYKDLSTELIPWLEEDARRIVDRDIEQLAVYLMQLSAWIEMGDGDLEHLYRDGCAIVELQGIVEGLCGRCDLADKVSVQPDDDTEIVNTRYYDTKAGLLYGPPFYAFQLEQLYYWLDELAARPHVCGIVSGF